MERLTYEEMKKLTWEQRKEILDFFGKKVIEEVRDNSLVIPFKIAKYTTINANKLEKYKALSNLSDEQQEAVCDLLSSTVTGVIYNFLEMFEENEDDMELIIKKDGKEYNMVHISEKMGSEIACYEDDGWIQKFSKIGRFVL